MAINNVIRYLGEASVPQDVRRRRRQIMGSILRVGTPVLIKPMYTVADKEAGIATVSPNYDDIYRQARHDDPFSFGTGFVSVETSDDEWITPDGELVSAPTSPGSGFEPAPKYRGYGPGFLTYAVLPDVATDFFKLSETGVLIEVQTATAQIGWYPPVKDNDLLVTVEIDKAENIIATHERYQLKQTNPVSIRGQNRYGRREGPEDWGNRHIINQQFELTRVPENDALYQVDTDR